jgi:hypothetical protein
MVAFLNRVGRECERLDVELVREPLMMEARSVDRFPRVAANWIDRAASLPKCIFSTSEIGLVVKSHLSSRSVRWAAPRRLCTYPPDLL